jgi:probable rRNA maturation factor
VIRFHINTQIDSTQADYSDILRAAARRALQHLEADPTELTIVVTDSEGMRALNRQFTGSESDTDVLAFPHGEIDPDHGRHYLGDIVISLPRAEGQAEEAGHALEMELALLSIHGTLHLLGYDDEGHQEREKMEALQALILASLDDLLAEEEGT